MDYHRLLISPFFSCFTQQSHQKWNLQVSEIGVAQSILPKSSWIRGYKGNARWRQEICLSQCLFFRLLTESILIQFERKGIKYFVVPFLLIMCLWTSSIRSSDTLVVWISILTSDCVSQNLHLSKITFHPFGQSLRNTIAGNSTQQKQLVGRVYLISESKGIVHQDTGELNALSYIISTVYMKRIMITRSSPGPQFMGAHGYLGFFLLNSSDLDNHSLTCPKDCLLSGSRVQKADVQWWQSPTLVCRYTYD